MLQEFVKDFCEYVAADDEVTGKDVPVVWSLECEDSCGKLKEMWTSIPVLCTQMFQELGWS